MRLKATLCDFGFQSRPLLLIEHHNKNKITSTPSCVRMQIPLLSASQKSIAELSFHDPRNGDEFLKLPRQAKNIKHVR